ncbi:MAG: hypothetical protein A4E66_02180 [Syntrophus sp. PtaB.Bin001]|nr:MAG: hypothetical protein A4E66_02180 [Syntrophus sp. PtaB.Bin001]
MDGCIVVRSHRSEFKENKGLSVKSQSVLPKENGAGGGDFDEGGEKNEAGRKENQPANTADDVKNPFEPQGR